MRQFTGVMIGLAVLAPASLAIADDPHITGTNTQSQSQSVGIGIGVGVSSTNLNLNSQGQGQYQEQKQKQQQNNQQSIAPSQTTTFKDVVQDRIPATVVAPGLTAAGTGVCLGSVSLSVAGPMAGIGFGVTKVDEGCERRSGAALLYQMGYKDAAIRLLSNSPEVKEALGPDAPKPRAAITPTTLTLAPAAVPSPSPANPACGDGRPATLTASGWYSCDRYLTK